MRSGSLSDLSSKMTERLCGGRARVIASAVPRMPAPTTRTSDS